MSQPTAARAMVRADEAHARIESHEELCAERYKNIHVGLGDLKRLVWGIIVSVAGASLLMLGTIFAHAAHLS